VLRLTSLGLAGVLLLSAAATPSAAADTTVRLIYHGARTKPVVALTFDDGYSASNCGKVLDILQAKHVMATFFPYARAVKGSPAFWRRVADAGYPIANHTTSHPMLTNLTLAQATREISAARSIIEKVTGKPMIRVFRPPYGAWNKMVVEAARAAGFPTILLWDVDDRDWSRSMTASGMLRAAEKGTPSYLNDLAQSVLEFVAETNRERSIYRSHGYGFVTVPELLSGEVPARAFGPPAPAVTPPPPPPSPRPQPVDPDRAPFSLSDLVWIHRHEVFAL